MKSQHILKDKSKCKHTNTQNKEQPKHHKHLGNRHQVLLVMVRCFVASIRSKTKQIEILKHILKYTKNCFGNLKYFCPSQFFHQLFCFVNTKLFMRLCQLPVTNTPLPPFHIKKINRKPIRKVMQSLMFLQQIEGFYINRQVKISVGFFWDFDLLEKVD